ncbi:MAG: HEAT repeat domain-containing protein, partial [Elusimicrobia bacterium]|nr:HEAT repeat domain-containing protein [Elusimicrobiota bacterium]
QTAPQADNAESIIQALTSGSPQACDEAVDILLGEKPEITQKLINVLKNSNSAGREQVAKSLGRLGCRQAIPILVSSLTSPDKSLRLAAAWSLYRIGDQAIVPDLVRNLNDHDPEIRRYLVHILGGMGDLRAMPHLIKSLNDASPLVRKQAVIALMSLEGQNQDVVKQINKARKDANEHVRRVAREAVTILKGDKTDWRIFAGAAAILVVLLAAGLWFYKRNEVKKHAQFPYLIDLSNEKGVR